MEDKKTQELNPIVKLRRIVKCGHSYYIALPQQFVKFHALKPGEKIPVLANHILKVVPMKER